MKIPDPSDERLTELFQDIYEKISEVVDEFIGHVLTDSLTPEDPDIESHMAETDLRSQAAYEAICLELGYLDGFLTLCGLDSNTRMDTKYHFIAEGKRIALETHREATDCKGCDEEARLENELSAVN